MWTSLLTPWVAVLSVLGLAAIAAAQPVSFQRDVLPLLSDRCFPCHGPDERARQSTLRLDLEASALRTLDPVIVPGRSSDSRLIARVTADDPGERMPPLDSHLSLSSEEVATLRQWIDEGARWGRHWAFDPPAQSTPPAVADGAWVRNAIDRFVLFRLEREGLRPAPEAEGATLLRRVTLDLTGLPPSLEELDAFMADGSDDAYERVVDRLLASPRYGERMAWEWLDAARYADTDGFQQDPTRSMWPWRDWLIEALNDNLPFDQFTVEALAGDLLPHPTPEQIVASAFNRNHMHNGEGGRIPEETRVENVFDRTETTATVWLGLTMTCARCHDHKYDPITQRDYYRLFAFFDQTSETGVAGQGKAPPTLMFRTKTQRARLAELDEEIATVARLMREPDPSIDGQQGIWERQAAVGVRQAAWVPLPITIGTWEMLGPLDAPEGAADKTFDHDYGPEGGIDVAQSQEDGQGGAWRPAPELADGRVHPLSTRVGATYLRRVLDAPSARAVDISLGSDDGIRAWLNGVPVLSKNVKRGVAPDQERVRLDLVEGRNDLLLKIVNTGGPAGVYFRKVGESVAGLSDAVANALLVASESRDADQRAVILEHYRAEHSPRWRASSERLAALSAERARIEGDGAVVMVMDTLPDADRRESRVLERGAYDRPLEPVTEGTPAFLPPMSAGEGRDRLSLARWLVAGENPLTARVTVNRAWQSFFGRGLVETSENFGQQGAPPSHPELLDWLARTFVDGGWNMKALHRLVVMSATYRQSSRRPRAAYEADPDNVLLARGPRFRMPSWMLRDQALAFGGLLVETIGGPSVKPYQPDGVWADATFGTIRYQADVGDALYRRSLYVFWRRIVGPTMFFDAGKRQTCIVNPSRTNSPLHALTTLNETLFVEAARSLAARTLREGGGDVETRIAWAFRVATSRRPSKEELDILVARCRSAREAFARSSDEARMLLEVGESPLATALDPAEHAAYTVVCSILLNLDEVLCKP